jgi:hypothetical protein
MWNFKFETDKKVSKLFFENYWFETLKIGLSNIFLEYG